LRKIEYALITGASTGIGFELANLCAIKGFNLVLIERSSDKLVTIANELREKNNVKVKTIAKDLSTANSGFELFLEIQKENLRVELLINNAGFGGLGNFSDTDLQYELDMIQVNITSLIILTKLFLQKMRENNFGIILNVASTAAYQPGPSTAIYYALKVFVLNFSEAVSKELQGSNVSVTTLCPGPTKTEFQQRASMSESKLFRSNLIASSESVARIGLEAALNRKRVIIPGFLNKVSVYSSKLLPRGLIMAIVNYLHSKGE
jgi:short-subunit dehydrogenase